MVTKQHDRAKLDVQMSKSINTQYLTMLLIILCPFFAHAVNEYATIDVSATIVPACETGTVISGGSISFGTLDFGQKTLLNQDTVATGGSGSGGIRIKCVQNTNVAITMSAGNSGNINQRYMQNSVSGQKIFYNLYTNSTNTTVWDNVTGVSITATGVDQWLPVYGLVPAQTSPAVGVYTDVIPVTITW